MVFVRRADGACARRGGAAGTLVVATAAVALSLWALGFWGAAVGVEIVVLLFVVTASGDAGAARCVWTAPASATGTAVDLVVDRTGNWTYPGPGARIVSGIGQEAYFEPGGGLRLHVLVSPPFILTVTGPRPAGTSPTVARQTLEALARQVAARLIELGSAGKP